MKSRNEYSQDLQPSRRVLLFRSGAAAGVVIAVLAVAALLPKDGAPGASTESGTAAASKTAAPAVPQHIRESAGGVDPLHPHEYAGQPAVF